MDTLQDIPEENETFSFHNVTVTVKGNGDQRIQTVRMEVTPAEEMEETEKNKRKKSDKKIIGDILKGRVSISSVFAAFGIAPFAFKGGNEYEKKNDVFLCGGHAAGVGTFGVPAGCFGKRYYHFDT